MAALGPIPSLELTEWAKFEEEFGPLTMHERIDHAAAYVAYVVHASAGGQGKPEDFTFAWKPKPDVDIFDWLAAVAVKA